MPSCIYFVCVSVLFVWGCRYTIYISISIELKRSQEEEVEFQPDFGWLVLLLQLSARRGGRFRIGRGRHRQGGEYDAPALAGAAPYVA